MGRYPNLALVVLLVAGCGKGGDPVAEWPEGSYCVLRARDSCPIAANGDFHEGTIIIDTDDDSGDDSSADDVTGASSAGGGDHARLELCCGDFAPSPATFPPEPFAVVAGGSTSDPLCPSDFVPGRVFVDAEDEELGEDADSRTEGLVGAAGRTAAGNIEIDLCEATPVLFGELPPGGYCLFAGGDELCPAGFAGGLLVTDDEDSGNTDEIEGAVGGISQADSTTFFPLCCT